MKMQMTQENTKVLFRGIFARYEDPKVFYFSDSRRIFMPKFVLAIYKISENFLAGPTKAQTHGLMTQCVTALLTPMGFRK
jgi:hypothetical protein